MRILAKAKIKRIEQAHTLNVFGTINLPLSDIAKGVLNKLSLKSMTSKADRLKGYELVVKLRKPSAEHQFSYLYEQLANRFGEKVDGKFVMKKEMKDKLSSINSPYSASTFILNEFFLACDDLTRQGQAPFEGIDQKIVTDLEEKRSTSKVAKKQEEVVVEQEVIEELPIETTSISIDQPANIKDSGEILDPTMAMLGIGRTNYAAEMAQHERSLGLPI